MRDIATVFGLKQTAGDIGIEIEVEGAGLPEATALWKKERDGSLKPKVDAAEYVLRKPVPIKKVAEVLEELRMAFKGAGSEVEDTYRAGIHVHVNVQDLSVPQLINMVCLFIITEDFYIDFCDKSRRGNHFCLRTSDAGYFTEMLWQVCEEGNFKKFRSDDLRYSAINLQSLYRYGSVEFRALESTQDYAKIRKWVKMLHQLKVGALKFKTPEDIMSAVSMEGYDYFLYEVLGEFAPEFMQTPGWKKKVRQGILRCQDICYSRDWGVLNLNIFSKSNDFDG